jgi:hypothetical protein
MNPVTAALLSGALLVGGKWAQGKAPTLDNGIGIAGIAVSLAIIEQMNEKLAIAFAWLIVLSMAVVYFPAIVKGTGLGAKK